MRALSCLLALALGVLAPSYAQAGGKRRFTPEQVRETCARIATDGLPEWRQIKWNRIQREKQGERALPVELPVVFHVVNHKGGFLGGMKISEREINEHLESTRRAFNPCGIAVVPEEIHYWDAPDFLSTLSRNSNTHRLSDEERCLFRGVHRKGRINVYFMEGVTGLAGAYAHADYWHESEQADDEDFVGAALISDLERGGGMGRTSVRYTVVPHEIGHPLMNASHEFGGQYNLMADSRELMSLIVTQDQCRKAGMSRFVRWR